MNWHRAALDESPLLARMNAELIQDEGHANRMTVAELEPRMRGWLAGEYSAVLFEEDGVPVAYALFRDDEGRGVLLRQFFVARDCRRRGVGRKAFELLVSEVLPSDTRVVVEVLVENARALAFWAAVGFADYARTLERRPAAR
jgi:GNAT superfamily N-acetyltransferase